MKDGFQESGGITGLEPRNGVQLISRSETDISGQSWKCQCEIRQNSPDHRQCFIIGIAWIASFSWPVLNLPSVSE